MSLSFFSLRVWDAIWNKQDACHHLASCLFLTFGLCLRFGRSGPEVWMNVSDFKKIHNHRIGNKVSESQLVFTLLFFLYICRTRHRFVALLLVSWVGSSSYAWVVGLHVKNESASRVKGQKHRLNALGSVDFGWHRTPYNFSLCFQERMSLPLSVCLEIQKSCIARWRRRASSEKRQKLRNERAWTHAFGRHAWQEDIVL